MIEPVRLSIQVPLEPFLAFDLFVRRLPEWWPLVTRSVWLDKAIACRVEAFAGGRITEEGPGGATELWGTIRRSVEPENVLIDWHPGLTAQHSTEVEIWFKPAAAGTKLVLEHRNWERLGDRGDFVRSLYANGWAPLLDRFAALARGTSNLPDVWGPGCIEANPAA